MALRKAKLKEKAKKRGQYYLEHYTKDVKARVDISKTELKTGMVCSIDYRADYRVNKKTSLYLVISANHDGLVHVIDLDYVSPRTFKKFKLLANNTVDSFKKGNWEIYYFPFKYTGQELYQHFVNDILDEQAYRRLQPVKIRMLRVCIMLSMEDVANKKKTKIKENIIEEN